MQSRSSATKFFKEKALELGFDQVGISRAEFMDAEAKRLDQWLRSGFHGKMAYMENHFDKRVDPRLLVPGAKSVISLSYNYYNPTVQEDSDAPKISMYAYGRDYHKTMKKKLKLLLKEARQLIGNFTGRCFVDSAPILERDWAKRSGLGWIGKHTLLLSKKKGSFFFLCEIVLDLELDYDHPVQDHCGSCTKCIDACPTQAIDANGYILESDRCISYLTIELREEIPADFMQRQKVQIPVTFLAFLSPIRLRS